MPRGCVSAKLSNALLATGLSSTRYPEQARYISFEKR